MASADLSVIIPTHNRAALLSECLRALEAQSAPRDAFEVLVLDDGSTDETRRMLEGRPFDLRLRSYFRPHGGANAARNHGAAAAAGRLLLFLGDDMLAAPDLVAAHLGAHARCPEESTGVLGHIE